MIHTPAIADQALLRDFESGTLSPSSFDHRAHIRVAYVYLTQQDPDTATTSIRRGLTRFLAANNVPASKYHETVTRAWVLAVYYFMQTTVPSASADEFIDRNPALLDPSIMLTHYSQELLYSATARAGFVPPDLDPIPSCDPS